MNVLKDAPGPHKMRAWNPGEGIVTACGITSMDNVEMMFLSNGKVF